MGVYFRKALGFGPLRVNLSKSGVGLSVGVTGARIGINPRGQAYVHAGRGGFYVRQNLGGPTSTHEPSPPPPHVAPNVTAFESTDAAQLSDASLADILAAFERVRRRTSRVSLVVFAALVVFAIGAGAAQLRIVELPDFAWIIAAVGVAAASAVALSRASDIDKRDGVVRLTLNLEPAVEESVTEFHKALTELRRCDRAWLVSTSERTGDWKRNAGAISLVSRTVVTPS